ncbi:MAG: sigma-70 family RNA polymerase sigma factor [Myxococcota bacterium]|nr:sigma-70 family RNA polymerase sigma factor [Myxococcota bacterium]
MNLVSSYMGQIAKAPLLSADQERVLAEELVANELRFWQLVLVIPRGLRTAAEVFGELGDGEDEKPGPLGLALHAAATNIDDLPKHKVLDELAWHCRAEDPDRIFFSTVMMRISVRLQGRGSRAPFERNLGIRQMRKVSDQFDVTLERRNRFVKSNLRLVVSVARDFKHHNLGLLDLVQDGNLGLIRAVHRFDPRMGFRFSTYAHWWIRQAVERSILNRGSTIRVPVHVHDTRRAVRKSMRELNRKLGRDASHEEIGAHMGISAEKVDQVLNFIPRDPYSLDAKLNRSDGDASLMDVIADVDARLPDEAAIVSLDGRRALKLLAGMSKMEQDIVKRRFGLGGVAVETLESIGKSYDLSRERIRQIQARTIKRLQALVEVNV